MQRFDEFSEEFQNAAQELYDGMTEAERLTINEGEVLLLSSANGVEVVARTGAEHDAYFVNPKRLSVEEQQA